MSAVVIYCDASVPKHLPKPYLVGWGAVFVRGDDVSETSGVFAWPYGDMNSLAELMAAREALKFAVAKRIARRGDTVFIASDCEVVRDYVGRRPRSPKQIVINESAQIERIGRRAALLLYPVHVKGHNGDDASDPHTKHNCRADRLAKIACGIRQS